MLKEIACAIAGHRPDKSLVRHDGQDFVAPCRGCGQLMYKTRMGDRPWKLDDGIRAYSNPQQGRARSRRPAR
jgi:hypothetical protein